ncbi:ABC transporter ATP-binding protein [Chitinophaga nivalis]|uniref:ABC transporter ATP-binding protein/permease n=1 Tax=Chitinophaga nivalis TaxID=2991709 RepID=A0ABT3ITY2_9BACT|nr:ABC transporter ATP-binding protein [Chitinophaga nivalis]MCW3463145.1 ABC transporter ATP-binding protein/permease [Chitinophaga nivalis]MCW3487165.1 ABC transporter ATP-binding protein/permease [Chitinophaga nivalis]
MKETKPRSGVSRLLEIAGKRKKLLLLSAILAVAHVLLAIVPYILIYTIIKAMLTPPVDVALIQHNILLAAGASLASYALLYASGMASHVAAFNILYELRKQMAEKLGKLPLGFINKNNSGALKKIMADDVERIENFIAHSIPDFVKGITLPLITLVYLFVTDWRLAISSCLPIVLLAAVMPLLFSKKRTDVLREYHRSLEEMNAGIVEFVRGMPVIKIFGHTAGSFDQYSGRAYRFKEMVIAYIRDVSPGFGIFISFISNASLPVLALGSYLYFSGGITLSVLFLFLILGVGYIRPLFALSNLGSQISLINHGVKRLDEILFSHEQETAGHEVLSDDFSIRFENVSFSYDGKRNVLERVNFTVPQGTITALVGPSGSGKSTAAQLVARFWDVQEGHIFIGQQDIRKVAPEELMRQVSFVFQDNFMFHQSLYENIRMGMDKTAAEIVAAAKAAQCHDFISKLPQGYETFYGSKGVHLSGGEQQRIQLARAILKDAPVLVLDEATAFSDPENEQLIQQAFNKLISNKTVIIIAHRLSTITSCDQIVVMKGGQVVGSDQHTQLLESCELYANMWNAHTRAKNFAITA